MTLITSAIESFLNINYPCACDSDDPNCAKEHFEAVEVAHLVKDIIDEQLGGVPDSELRSRLDKLFPARVS
jgi:hypothetical protein